MKLFFGLVSLTWGLLCLLKILYSMQDVEAFESLEIFTTVNVSSALISFASLILLISFYHHWLHPMSVFAASILKTLTMFGYYASWLSFGTNLTLVALNEEMQTFLKLQQTQSGLLPYAAIDCFLICLQLSMIAIEAQWFVKTERVELEYLESGYPLATLTYSIHVLFIVIPVLQLIKIAIVVLQWPISNDATAVFAILTFAFTILNSFAYGSYKSIMRSDTLQKIVALVVMSLAFLLGWGAVGSTLIMMDIESKESYRLLFEIELATAFLHVAKVTLLHYLALNMHMLKGSSLYL